MKTILILLFPIVLLAQYGNNLIINGDLESYSGTQDDGIVDDFDSWGETASTGNVPDATITYYGGSNAVKIIRTDNWTGIYQTTASSLNNSTVYSFSVMIRGDGSSTDGDIRFREDGSSSYWNVSTETWGASIYNPIGITATSYTELRWDILMPSSGTGTFQVYMSAADNGDLYYADNIAVRQKLDTLYIDPSSGHDSSLGDLANPIETWAEYEIRGSYDGGVVMWWNGSVWEDVTVDGIPLQQKHGFGGFGKWGW